MNKIIIKNGVLTNGSLDKNTFTKTSKGLIHTIYNDFGHDRAADFINDDDSSKFRFNKIIIKLSQKYFLIKISFIFSEMCTIRPYKTD